MELDPKLIGEIVRTLRKSENMSQERFAEQIDISVRSVSNIENGTVLPLLTTVVNISEHFDCTIEQILGINNNLL